MLLRTKWERLDSPLPLHCLKALLSADQRRTREAAPWSQTHRIGAKAHRCTDDKTMTAAVPVFPLANLEQHVDALRKTCHETGLFYLRLDDAEACERCAAAARVLRWRRRNKGGV